VIGVGGGGSNAVKRMMESEIEGVDFWSLNTDVQALGRVYGARTMTIGNTITRGLGAGGVPDIGRRAADESRQQIQEIVQGTDLVFVTAGMGGGTGSGAAPVVAEVAKEAGALTVGVVTKPFSFEGRRRMAQANQAIAELEEAVDTLIVVNNDQLLKIIPADTPVEHAFKVADDVLRQGVVGISDIIVKPGLINVDFADVRSVMGEAGTAMMGIGRGSGKNRAKESAEGAIMSALLDVPITGAQGIVFNVLGGNDMTLQEINAAAEVIYANVDPNANIIFGALVDGSMGDDMAVTVIATGFGGGRNAPVPRAEAQNIKTKVKKPLPSPVKREPTAGIQDSRQVCFPQFLRVHPPLPSQGCEKVPCASFKERSEDKKVVSPPQHTNRPLSLPLTPPPFLLHFAGQLQQQQRQQQQQEQQQYQGGHVEPSEGYWPERIGYGGEGNVVSGGQEAGAASMQYGAGGGSYGYSAQQQGLPQPIADSRGYYPGEKGYNPDLAPPPMPVAPQMYPQGGGASEPYVEGSEVFIPDGFGGFVRRPFSPPPMEKKVGNEVLRTLP
ncbi:unnamed protein product, partial [Ectocarpus sp. 13 AM-2016]